MAGKLGIIAGGGGLPEELARACDRAGREVFVIRLKGMTEPGLASWPGEEIEIARLGRMIEALRGAGCEAVTFVGAVKRPDFASLKPDLAAMAYLPGVLAAARKGDDALLRALLRVFEHKGFRVEGAHEAAGGLVLEAGPLGALAPGQADMGDIETGLAAARALGEHDIGQAVAVCGGLVLAVEAQEGTAAMLERCAGLPAEIRGSAAARRGVLVKWPKPIQDRRVDLPTIGPATVEKAAAAGLAGIVGQAGGLLVVEREAVIAAADRLRLFVYGVDAGGR